MRVIPNMVVIAPADVHEARKATLAAAKYEGSVYIRVGRSNTPVVTTPESPFEIGKAEVMYMRDESLPTPVAIVVTGTLLFNALRAAEELESSGVGATVLHMPTIKPLDTEALLGVAKEHIGLVTVEEHQQVGGLGGAVTEYLSGVHPTKVLRVGVNDQFGQSGEPEELIAHYGMGIETIVARAKELL
jgi:transketolase